MIPSPKNTPHSLPDCAAVGELLSAYLDGELTAGEKEAVEAHLQTCDACRHLAEALGSLRTEIRGAELTPPPELRSSIMKQIHRENRLRRIRRLTAVGSVGAAAMLCLVIIGNAVLGSLTAADSAAPEAYHDADMAYSTYSSVGVMDATVEAELQRAGTAAPAETAAPAGKGDTYSVTTATTAWAEEVLEPVCTSAPEETLSGRIVAAILPQAMCSISLEEALKQSTLTFAPEKAESYSVSAPNTLQKMVHNPLATLAEQQLGILCTVELTDGNAAAPYVYDLTNGRQLTLTDFLGEAMETLSATFPIEPNTPFCPTAEGLVLWLTEDEIITLVWDAFPVLDQCISRFAMDAPPLMTLEGARIIP